MPKNKENPITAFLLTPEPVQKVEGDLTVRDEYILKIIDEVFSTKDIQVKTDLTVRQIKAFAKGEIFAEEYNCDIMKKLCNKMMILSVSKDRKGRKEFTEISKSIQAPLEEDMTPTIKTRLLGE